MLFAVSSVAASRQPRESLHQASIPVLLGGAGALTTLCLRPTSIPVLLGGAGAYTAMPRSLPFYATGNMERWVGKTQKTANCKEKRSMPESAM